MNSAERNQSLNLDMLRLACHELARSIHWRHDPVDKLVAWAVVDGYVKLARDHERYLIDSGRDPNMLCRAVRYMASALAVPAFAGDMSWFSNSLETLLELAYPSITLDQHSGAFLHDIEDGIAIARARVKNE